MDARIFLVYLVASFFISIVIVLFWGTLNQRIFIPMARWLRFKRDDTKMVNEKVSDILKEDKVGGDGKSKTTGKGKP